MTEAAEPATTFTTFDTFRPEAPFQVSDKWGENIFVVRGWTVDEFIANMEDIFGKDGTDERLLGIAGKPAPTAPATVAENNLNAAGVATERVSGSGKFCAHGEKLPTSGISKKTNKQWNALDCPDGVCDREWVR